jgi:ABC-type multidrug transport system ATPase subunit
MASRWPPFAPPTRVPSPWCRRITLFTRCSASRKTCVFLAACLVCKGRTQNADCAAIAFARLEQVVDKRAEQLSGGLRRRLNLAIGLLGQPQLLLLDEPTVGVDPQSRHFLLDAIAALPAAGTTVIYTSHYMEEVEAICQNVAIIDQGQVLAAGALDGYPAQPGTLARTASCPSRCRNPSQRFTPPSSRRQKYRLKLPSTAALPRLLDELAAAGCSVRDLNFRPAQSGTGFHATDQTLAAGLNHVSPACSPSGSRKPSPCCATGTACSRCSSCRRCSS